MDVCLSLALGPPLALYACGMPALCQSPPLRGGARAGMSRRPPASPQVIKRASESAAVLSKWVRAMDMYQRNKREVDPKRAALLEAEQQLAAQVGPVGWCLLAVCVNKSV